MPTSWLISFVVISLASGLGVSDRGGERNVAPGPGPAAASRPSYGSRPDGEWAAMGRVLSARNVGDERAGEVLSRRWQFWTVCPRRGRCRTMFGRTTAFYGAQRTELVAHHGYYTATFGPTPDSCERLPGLPGRFTALYRLWWSPDRSRLFAAERGVYSGRRCAPGSSRTRWVAFPRR